VHLAEKIAEYLRAAGLDVRIAEPVTFALVGWWSPPLPAGWIAPVG
jgi:predicted aminopeptidase